MKSIFNQLDPQAPNHRNAYDLSQRHLFSLKTGQKAPVCCIETLPKDFFDIDLLSLVRSMPINTAAFTRLKCTFDFIFVPYQQLWHGWNQFFLQNEENMSSGDSYEHDALPRFDLIALIQQLLINHLSFYASQLTRATFHTPSLSDCQEELGIDILDSFGYDRALGSFRLLDLLGYGSFYNYVDYLDDQCKSDSVRASINSILTTSSDWQTCVNSLYDLFEGLVEDFMPPTISSPYVTNLSSFIAWMYEPDPANPTTSSTLRSLWVNPFRILGYNKAWQDYTMNKRVQRYDATKFNVDAHNVIATYEMTKILEMHYEAWDYDFFTGVFTSPQDGDVSLISGNSSIFLSPLPTMSSSPAAIFDVNTGRLSPSLAGVERSTPTKLVGPSVYDIKRAEFLQRWKENHLRAGSKSQRQAMSQWNTHFRYLSDEYSDFITSIDMVVNIDDVINTADNQGDISGKGIGTSNGHFKYECNDAGIIICLLSVKPRAEYDATMIDKQNTCLQPFDFPSPFFDNLGLEAIPSYLLNLQHYRSVDSNNNIGYSVRYLPWKSAIDKVHGEFMSSYYTKNNGAGGLSIWATPRKELANADYKDDIDTLFYVNPNVCDPIFAAAADSSQDTDHFLFNTNFLVRVVRNLSVSGMPTWNV